VGDKAKISSDQQPATSDVSGALNTGAEASKLNYRLILMLKGFCMGTADVIPGVSGGTMAFILGIYRELITAIKSFDLIWLQSLCRLDVKSVLFRPHLGFLLPLFSGIILAILFFTRVIPLPELLHIYPEQIYGLFFGLIAGSCVVLVRNISNRSARDLFAFLPGVVIGLIVFNLVPVETPDAAWFIFLSGALAITAMILPGISGSFVLLILNKYTYIFNAIGYFKFSVLLPFVLGMVTGLVIFSRVLAWVLDRYYRATLMFITGLLVASLWVIWPFQQRQYESVNGSLKLISSSPGLPVEVNAMLFLSFVFILVGLLLVIFMDHVAVKKRATVSEYGK
jgi:putative membrane protein